MKILVAYESHRGHTRQTAEAIGVAARRLGCEAIVKPVSEVQFLDIQRADALFVGTWVQGLILFGVRPAGARKWVPTLPPLAGKPIAVFCTFAVNPRGALRLLGDLLMERGATIMGEHAFRHSQPDEGAEQFVKGVLDAARVSAI